MKGITPELMAQIEAERQERAAQIAKVWREGLSHKDWLFDGSAIRGPVMMAKFGSASVSIGRRPYPLDCARDLSVVGLHCVSPKPETELCRKVHKVRSAPRT